MPFLDAIRLSTKISYGSKGGPMFSTSIAVVNAGYEARNANWLYPLHKYNISYGVQTAAQMWEVRETFYVARGMADGFRFKDWHDYTSGINNASATALDTHATFSAVSASSTYQLNKQYYVGSSVFTRKITKPRASTVVVAVGSVAYSSTDYSTVASTGRITFVADISVTVSGITQAISTIVSATGHGYVTGDTVYFANVSGTTEMNGNRYTVTSVTPDRLELDVDSTGFTAWASAGDMHTHPQDGEPIQAGYVFDVPVRFNSDFFDVVHDDFDITNTAIEVVELR